MRIAARLKRLVFIPTLVVGLAAACADHVEPTEALGADSSSTDDTTFQALYAATLPAPLPTVAYVDPARYIGVWYEIASVPQFFSVGCTCTTATYTLVDATTLGVFNECRLNAADGPVNAIAGRALVSPATGNARLQVEFLPIFRAPYWIIALADDYSTVMIGDPTRGSLFILARARTLNATTYTELLAYAGNLGFNTARVNVTPQTGCP